VTEVFKGRYTAAIEGDFVVFLIGPRFGRLWRVWEWWPVFAAMPRMLKELHSDPALGFLGGNFYLSFENKAPMMVQYWRSFEHLDSFARTKDHAHLPAWREFNRRARRGNGVGIWHETYLVAAGKSEAVYGNMPRSAWPRQASTCPRLASEKRPGGAWAARTRWRLRPPTD